MIIIETIQELKKSGKVVDNITVAHLARFEAQLRKMTCINGIGDILRKEVNNVISQIRLLFETEFLSEELTKDNFNSIIF